MGMNVLADERSSAYADIREPDRFGQQCTGYLPFITNS